MTDKTRQDKLSSFLNPKPLKKLEESKHGQAGQHLDDTGDIYDHTKSFFNKDQLNDYEDIGPKRIKGDISTLDLDTKIYGAQKSSRNQREIMMQQHESESSQMDAESAESEFMESVE